MKRGNTRVAVVALAAGLMAAAFVPVANAGTDIQMKSIAPSVGVWGTTFSVRGETDRNISVRVQRMYIGSSQWQTVTTTTSDDDGNFVAVDQPFASAWYRAYVVSDLSTSNWVKGEVRPGVHISVGSSGRDAIFTGRVLPSHPGTRVILQLFDGINKQWVNVGSGRLSSSSSYRMAFRGPDSGRRLFRVAWPTQDNNHQWNISAWVSVTWTRD